MEDQRKEEEGNGYLFNPIGYARSCYIHCQGVPRQPGLAPNARSFIEIEDWVPPPAFDDLTQYSHIWVLFVFHMNTNISTLHRSSTERGVTFPVHPLPEFTVIRRLKSVLLVFLDKQRVYLPHVLLIVLARLV